MNNWFAKSGFIKINKLYIQILCNKFYMFCNKIIFVISHRRRILLNSEIFNANQQECHRHTVCQRVPVYRDIFAFSRSEYRYSMLWFSFSYRFCKSTLENLRL